MLLTTLASIYCGLGTIANAGGEVLDKLANSPDATIMGFCHTGFFKLCYKTIIGDLTVRSREPLSPADQATISSITNIIPHTETNGATQKEIELLPPSNNPNSGATNVVRTDSKGNSAGFVNPTDSSQNNLSSVASTICRMNPQTPMQYCSALAGALNAPQTFRTDGYERFIEANPDMKELTEAGFDTLMELSRANDNFLVNQAPKSPTNISQN